MNPDPHDIFRAAAEGDLSGIRRYLAAGHSVKVCSLDEKWGRGSTPLHLACEAGEVEAARLLLNAGADADATDRLDHWTALHRCASEQQAATLRLLLEHGATVDSFGHEGETPLHMAAMGGFTEGVRLLLKAGADPNLREGPMGETALHHAAGNLSAGCVRLLMAAGANINAGCYLGRTPLDCAAEDGWYPDNAVYELLLSRGGKTGEEVNTVPPAVPPLSRKRLHDILETLVSFRSDAAHPQEREACLEYAESLLADKGAHTRRLGSGKRQQLIAALNTPALRDMEGGLMLCGHLDVVPGSDEQFELWSEAGRLYGRGTVDMKSSIACFLHLLPTLAQQPFPVILAFTTDEESDMEGIEQVCDFLREHHIRPALTLLGEPTGEQIGRASSGLCSLRTEIYGEAAHSSRPEDGLNALYIAARLLHHLEKLGLESAPRGILVNAGRLEGGGDPATVPDRATLHWGFRSFAPEQEEAFMANYERAVRQVRMQYPGCRVETEELCRYSSFSAGNEATHLATELSCLLGYPQARLPYTTEAGILQEHGHHVLLLGAGQPGEAHREAESIHAAELAAYEKALQKVCQWLSTAAPLKKT